MGSGVTGLGDATLTPGDTVSERHLERLIGQGRDPVTGDPLGRAYPEFQSVTQRVSDRVRMLSLTLSDAERDQAVTLIRQEEASRPVRRAVAGFDFTFSVPKSVSALWAVADEGTQALIVQAHHDAINEVIGFMERQVAATRTGSSSRDGSVVQADVTGVIATGFDHYDSRAGDPHLHTHVVIANRVQAVHDGRWRTLDSRPLHAATVALSEYHQAVLADRMTRLFGVGWDTRTRGQHRNPSWDITGVSEDLVAEFSTRSRGIDIMAQRLVAEYTVKHGREPAKRVILKLRQQATLATRPDKHIHSLAELTDGWRDRATSTLGEHATRWAQHLLNNNDRPSVLRADDVPLDVVDHCVRSVLARVGEKRSTWRRWNLWAETARQTMGWRFASPTDREHITAQICDAAERLSIRLTPADIAVPVEFTRTDGTTRFRPRHTTLYTSQELIDAEARLLDLSRRVDGPTLDPLIIDMATMAPDRKGRTLSDDQAQALAGIAASGRVVDVLVGPAGAGKTTALTGLRTAWEHAYGPSSVIGLAPSATAAHVLGEDLGIPTENTAKWLSDHDRRGTTFTGNQLVIVDEASLAGTFTLDRITDLAAQAGAKVLLVGDYAQLGAVDAGGAFHLLVHDRDDAPELTDIHRFTHQWEKLASLHLRHGDPDVIPTYQKHGRITGGNQEMMIEQAYQAWQADTTSGCPSVLIADNHHIVTILNQRAREDRIHSGAVNPIKTITLTDGIHASKGDAVITRRNDRRLTAGRTGWVRNGDRWTITRVHDDGSITIRRAGYRFGASLVLPAPYVAEHVDLGYAVTTHRAQGITTNTSHVLVTTATTRENLYVGLTRGRYNNHAWVATDQPDDTHASPYLYEHAKTATDVLTAVLKNSGTEPSAHQTAQYEHKRWNRIDYLVAMYMTIYNAAQHERWATLIANSGLEPYQVDQVLASDAFQSLCAELARMESLGRSPETTLPRIIASRPLDGSDDMAAVLHHRVEAVNDNPNNRPHKRQRYILVLVPEVIGPIRDDMRTSLRQIENKICSRAQELAQQARVTHQPWLDHLVSRPADPRMTDPWNDMIAAIAAYRENWNITDKTPYGAIKSSRQKQDAIRLQLLARDLLAGNQNSSPMLNTPDMAFLSL